MGFLAAQSLDMLHKFTHKWLCQHATAHLGNGFNPLCHEAVAPLQANHSDHVCADNCHHPPSRTTGLSAVTSFCHLLWRLDTASAPQYLLISKSTYWLLPSWQVSNSCSQLHLSAPLPKETILERRQAKRQWLRWLAQTSSITRVSDIGYKILQCMKKTSFVSVVM